MRDSAVFYKSWKQAIDRLGDGERGRVYEMIMDYAIDGKEPETDDPVIMMIFDLVKVQIDINNRRYENGKKGGRPVSETNEKPNRNQTETKTKPKQNQTETKPKPNVNENENENVNVYRDTRARTRETPAEMFDRLIVGRAVGHEIADVLRDEWLPYKQERREPYKETGMKTLITQAVNASARCGPSAVVELIRSSIASGYKGIVWDRLEKQSKPSPTSRFNNADERSYDMSDLETQLLKASGIL